MSYSKVLINFSSSRYSDQDLISKAGFIVEHLTGNTHFPTPFPLLQDLSDATTQFGLAYLKAQDGTKEDTATKNLMRVDFEFLLRKIALYVETESSGDAPSILSAGFDIHKTPEPAGPLVQATGLTIEQDSNSGVVHVSCDIIDHAYSYLFEYTESPIQPQSVWLNNISTKRKTTINGLTSGQLYIFRVAGIGSDPTRKWSETITRMII